MEEIKVDYSALNDNSRGLALFNYLFVKAQKEGIQVGITWNQAVYEYLFETESMVDLEPVLGLDVLDIDMQDSFV